MKTTYTTTVIEAGKKSYSVLVANGRFNYVSIKQNNHVRGAGKEFANFDEAVKHYNTAEIKGQLLMVEMGLIPHTDRFIA